MELSPLAREKLARIGELTDEEKFKLRNSEQLTSLLADYFTNELNSDDLWQELKKHKDEGRGFLLKDAQLKILDAMRLSSSDMDINKLHHGLLAAETLKDSGDHANLELELKSIEDLRRQYKDERDQAYNKIKVDVESQVRSAVQQLSGGIGNQRNNIDVQRSIEASVKASPEWKAFITQHDNSYNQKFNQYIIRLRDNL